MRRKPYRNILRLSLVVMLLITAFGCQTPTDRDIPPTTAPSFDSKYILSVGINPLGAGSVSPPAGEYEPGLQVILTATPASGYTFDYWDGAISGTAPTVTITMNSSRSVTAHFKVVQATVVPAPIPAPKPTTPPATISWNKTFGGFGSDVPNSIRQTSDGGFIIAGFTTSFGAGGQDAHLVKTDALGIMTWSKTFGGTRDDRANSVQQTSDGGFIIAGYTYSFGAGGFDAYLVKTDASGIMTWSKTFGGKGSDFASSVQQTSDGGFIITGYSDSFSAGNIDVYLLKTDVSGNMLWSKTFGGAGYEEARSVQQISDGGFIMVGSTNSSGSGSTDVYLLKTDASGNMLWNKTFGGTGRESAYSVQQTSDAGFIMLGSTNSFGAGDFDAYLVKADASGNMLWSKTFGGSGNEAAHSLQQISDGGFIIAGSTNSFGAGGFDVYLVKTDASGNMVWDKTFGGKGEDRAYSVQQTSDGGFIIVGSTDSPGTGLGLEVYLVYTP